MIITSEQFEAEVLKSDKPVLVKFYVEKGCKFCDQYSPIFSAFEQAHPEIKCVEIGKPELKSPLDALMAKYNPKDSYPMTLSFSEGQLVGKAGGIQQEEQLLALFKTLQNISDEELMTRKFDLQLEIAKRERDIFDFKNQAIKTEQEIIRRQSATPPPSVRSIPDLPVDPAVETECEGCS